MAATDGGGGGEAESRDGRSIFGNRMPGAVRRQEEATAAGRDSRRRLHRHLFSLFSL